MKITMYELLGMTKDGKAPKKIKWGATKYTLYTDEDTKQTYYQDDECKYFLLNIKCLDDLNDTVEILEEEKKIPDKLETYKDNNNTIFLDDLCYKYMPIHKDSLSFNEQVIVDKLNEVLDYLKSKGE